MRMLLWDFDGTLGYRQGLWSQALLDVLRDHHPIGAAMRDDIRPFLREGFPWYQPHISQVELETPEQWGELRQC
jgi:putative hydrolase of the HAD superfamily